MVVAESRGGEFLNASEDTASRGQGTEVVEKEK